MKDVAAVDQFLAEVDRVLIQAKAMAASDNLGRLGDAFEFYTARLPAPHTIRCLTVKLLGLKWRLFWGRIGDGLYLANRPAVLEDIAATRTPSAPAGLAHALLRLRPENWHEALPGYNLGWAEAHRAACHDNLSLIANVNRGWNDRAMPAGSLSADLLGQVTRLYGVRPFCPDGGTYTLSGNGKACQCSVHGTERAHGN